MLDDMRRDDPGLEPFRMDFSEAELEAVSGGGWGSCSSLEECRRQSLGDTREGIEPGKAHADFINGVVDGGELDW